MTNTALIPLTDREFWEQFWKNSCNEYQPRKITRTVFSELLESVLPINPNFTCAEIGAYPGDCLIDIARRFKYKPVAIEYTNRCKDIERQFQYNDITEYQIINEDVFALKNVQFDVVFSGGFIEHFEDYQKVVDLHFKLLKKDGYLVISVPHMGGIQELIRRLAFTKEKMNEIFATHNKAIMNLSALKKAVKKHDCEIIYASYMLGMKIWFTAEAPFIKNRMRWLIRLVKALDNKIGSKLPQSGLYSPKCILIAKKR